MWKDLPERLQPLPRKKIKIWRKKFQKHGKVYHQGENVNKKLRINQEPGEAEERERRHRNMKVECEFCHKIYGKWSLRSHQKNNCSGTKHERPSGAEIPRPFECDQCDYAGTTKRYLRVHMQIHSDSRPFECDLCDYKAKTSNLLKAHVVIHSDERPFKCDSCDFASKTSCNLNKHKKKHLKEK